MGCGQRWPNDRFNADCAAPDHCFKCRVGSVRLGFRATRAGFHGDDLVGGTIASDNRFTVAAGRSVGHDPVPVKTAGAVGVSAREFDRLKNHSGFGKRNVSGSDGV